ncbi:MAG: hypothetical protein AAGD86_10295, partial [Pseudomonadota bacterium]
MNVCLRHCQRRYVGSVAVLALVLGAAVAQAQSELRSTLFAEADQALKAANEARASVLAPSSYSDGVERYRDAEDRLTRGRSIDGIRKQLAEATAAFRKAAEAAGLAEITFKTALKARADAEQANAGQFAAEAWQEAEQKFATAAIRLEGGSVRPARS